MKTKNKIIQEAIKQFAIKGVTQTSFQSIADAINMKQTAVIYHFKSKSKLLKTCLRYVILNNSQTVDAYKVYEESLSAEQQLYNYILGNIEWATKNRHESLLILWLYYQAAHDKELNKTYNLILKNAITKIRHLIIQHYKERKITIRPPQIELTSESIHQLLVGQIINAINKENFKFKEKKGLEIYKLILNSIKS